jgi:hypoxanthine phosphoribosyltransferase
MIQPTIKKIDKYNVLPFTAIEILIDKYVQEIQNNKPECIVSLNRGGNIPATLLAYKLKINKIIFINMEAYDPITNEKHKTIKFEKPRKKDIRFLRNCKNILIVDDIFDTGKSLEIITDYLDILKRNTLETEYQIYTLVEKINNDKDIKESININCLRNLTTSGIKDDSNNWVIFPWDDEYYSLLRKWDIQNPAININWEKPKYLDLSGPHIKDLNG